jgi:heparosan-N-sulfate-glucuronate 5-epimerase
VTNSDGPKAPRALEHVPTGLLAHPRLVKARKFLSVSFHQPPGEFVADEGVRGYYVDMRVKADSPAWPGIWRWAPGQASWIAFSQRGLGAFERFVAGEGEEWLGFARRTGDVICDSQVSGGPRDGALEHLFDFPHTFPLRAPWVSAMAQGEAASLLVRLHLETGEARYAEAALRAVGPMSILHADGGASNLLSGRPFPEEYPTDPPCFVLNGAMYAMWGWYDVARGLGDSSAERAFEGALDTLAQNIHLWDTGWWSRYDLFEHPVRNLASFAYHELHIIQLRATHALAPRAELAEAADRFESYTRARLATPRAFAYKVAFRLRVPRNRKAANEHWT